jgi:hypothetical protein
MIASIFITAGDSSWTLPMPARYVIGTDGVIVYAEMEPRLHTPAGPPGASADAFHAQDSARCPIGDNNGLETRFSSRAV